jgi:acyl dehydratase
MGGQYFEDLEIGATVDPDGRYDVTASEIVPFGRDPDDRSRGCTRW